MERAFARVGVSTMKARTLIAAGVSSALLAAASFAAPKSLDPPRNAAEHKAGPAWVEAPRPERNPWAGKGIPSKHTFGACYTRKHHDGQDWHLLSRTDELADVSVRFGDESPEVLFGRVTSHHPQVLMASEVVASFKEAVPRSGDGPEGRPDKVNRHARARVIESTSERAVVHYRYLPEMPEQIDRLHPPDQRGFVDEYFLFRPDRSGLRAVRTGSETIEEWRDPARVKTSRFRIGNDGRVSEEACRGEDRAKILTVMGLGAAPVRKAGPAPVMTGSFRYGEPALSWHFDEGRGRTTGEKTGGTACPVVGHAAIWRQGVSGHALMYDGYSSKVELPASKVPKLEGVVTLEAWIAIAAYPWNLCPIVQQGDVLAEGKGIALGIGPHGGPLLAARMGEERFVLHADAGEFRIPRFRWTHVVGMLGPGHAALYLDGKKIASGTPPENALAQADDQPLRIGMGPPMGEAWPVGGSGFGPYPYGFEGLIDEVRVYDGGLRAQDVQVRSEAPGLTKAARTSPDMDRRVLPAGDKDWNAFGAHYTRLEFHDAWKSMFRMSGHPDVVVSFDKQPGRYVLWHGVGYIPMMVSENGRWYSNEFNETWWGGCCEPMSDKKMVYGRVHIVEESPAHVLLKWRYPLSNVHYKIYGEGWGDDTGWGEWCDWYFTIYPDGRCVKRMRIWMSKTHSHEWHESMAIFGPEQHPEEVVETRPALTLATLDGELREYDWIEKPPTDVDYEDVRLHVINLKADYDPYSIAPIRKGNVYKNRGDMPYSVFPAWNHWPVGQFPSDGRYVRYPDRTAHSSLTHLYWLPRVDFGEQGSFEEKVLIEGLSNEPVEKLVDLARSSMEPPAAEASHGIAVIHDPNTQAYSIVRDSGAIRQMTVRLLATAERPVVNPVFRVENWGAEEVAKIRINGEVPDKGLDIRQGVVRRANGVNALVIWVETTCREETTFEIRM
jgi:hypothetical protein